jgi:hypothetical protein
VVAVGRGQSKGHALFGCSGPELFPSKAGSLAMLRAMRRASSSVSTFAICASSGFSREQTYGSDC